MVLSSPNPALRAASGELTRLRDRVAGLERELQGERQRNQGVSAKMGDQQQHQVQRYVWSNCPSSSPSCAQLALELERGISLFRVLKRPGNKTNQAIIFFSRLWNFSGKATPWVVRCPADRTGIYRVTRPPKKMKIASLKRYLISARMLASPTWIQCTIKLNDQEFVIQKLE